MHRMDPEESAERERRKKQAEETQRIIRQQVMAYCRLSERNECQMKTMCNSSHCYFSLFHTSSFFTISIFFTITLVM